MSDTLALWLFFIALYFLPVLEAMSRKHPNAGAIAVVNIFLGWTFVGWVIALAWAFTNQRRSRA